MIGKTPSLFGDDLYTPGPVRPDPTCIHGTPFPAPDAPCCEAETEKLCAAYAVSDHSYTERVLARLVAKPGEWIDGLELAQCGGAYAWRSRVSDARRRLQVAGMGTIENEQVRQADGSVRSLYRYVASEG